jgi:hypothetical protein
MSQEMVCDLKEAVTDKKNTVTLILTLFPYSNGRITPPGRIWLLATNLLQWSHRAMILPFAFHTQHLYHNKNS